MEFCHLSFLLFITRGVYMSDDNNPKKFMTVALPRHTLEDSLFFTLPVVKIYKSRRRNCPILL